ncbi:hypothetical protein ABIA96_001693 [Bradyrhizobium sp. LB11.1]|jgi:hypothetical protein
MGAPFMRAHAIVLTVLCASFWIRERTVTVAQSKTGTSP